MKRFFEIKEIPGLGKVSYEKIFSYYYKNSANIERLYEQTKFDI